MSIGAVLRAPVSRRTWAEILYMLASAPLAVLGFGYALATLVLGTGLAVTAAGFPLLALGLYGARGITSLQRGHAAIAKTLVVSDRAVEKHIANIFLKLGLPASGDDHRRVLAVLRYLGA